MRRCREKLVAATLVLITSTAVFAADGHVGIIGACTETRSQIVTQQRPMECVGILARGEAAVRALVATDSAAQEQRSWQQRYDKAIARRTTGNTLLWTGGIMLATGVVWGVVPTNLKYCDPNYGYSTSECAKHATPPLVADILGAILMVKGRTVRAAAIRDLAVLDRERRGVR